MPTNWNKVVCDQELEGAKKERSREYIFSKERVIAWPDFESEGWEFDRNYKDSKFIGIKKKKKTYEIFENRVWLLLSKMGFTHMNSDNSFKIEYDSMNSSKQIDIFACDGETLLLLECKHSDNIGTTVDFKTDIESYGGIYHGICAEARKKYPKIKVKFIWVTNNIIMMSQDLKRIEEFNFAYFDESNISYYEELVSHLGKAARYQLLGNLFAGKEVKNLDNKIPAIQGKMGGKIYYSFSIEPYKLLKMGYVLHRNEANKNLMPTYQRIIKKKRLESVRSFVNSGGYFPNSLIISIDTGKKGLKFEKSSLQDESSISRIGILYLPQQYRSAYIIDGQHRLYGYSDSNFSNNNTIPVVAFVDLEREEQIKLFMDINENQKAVPKNLKNTLNADMLWNSKDFNQQRYALGLNIAQKLGEESTSVLKGRILVGEDEKNVTRCITIESINLAIKRSDFFNEFGKKNEIIKNGFFDKGTNENTRDYFYPFLELFFRYIKSNLEDEWKNGEENYGILTINIGIYALIKVLNDIINHLFLNNKIDKSMRINDIFNEVKFYLDPTIKFIQNINDEKRTDIRRTYGDGGKTKYWRYLQKEINLIRADFKPIGMQEWFDNNSKIYNEQAFSMLRNIKQKLKNIVLNEIKSVHLDSEINYIPRDIYLEAMENKTKLDYDNSANGLDIETTYEDFITFKGIKDIISYGSNWQDIFEKIMVRPEDENISGGKKEKTKWLDVLDDLERKNRQTYSISKIDYELILSVSEWLEDAKELVV